MLHETRKTLNPVLDHSFSPYWVISELQYIDYEK